MPNRRQILWKLSCRSGLLGVLLLVGGGLARAEELDGELAGSSVDLPLAPVVAVLVGLLVFVVLRGRAWLRLEVEPALRELRQAAEGLRQRSEPPVLRRPRPKAHEVPPLLGEVWVRAGEIALVGGGGPALAVQAVAEVLLAPRGTVVLAGEAMDDDALFRALSEAGVADALMESGRLLRVDLSSLQSDPSGVLALLGPLAAPVVLVATLSADGAPSRFIATVRDLVARSEPDVRSSDAAMLVVLQGGSPGLVRTLADAPALAAARWWAGASLDFPMDESTAARNDGG